MGISKSPLFVRGVVKTMFYGEHDENTLFSTENTRDTGHNFWRTCSLLFFYWRDKILCVYIFYSREKILYVDDFITFLFVIKKVLKIRFLEYGGVVNTRRSVLLYIYIYIYIVK